MTVDTNLTYTLYVYSICNPTSQERMINALLKSIILNTSVDDLLYVCDAETAVSDIKQTWWQCN